MCVQVRGVHVCVCVGVCLLISYNFGVLILGPLASEHKLSRAHVPSYISIVVQQSLQTPRNKPLYSTTE